jgi:hypothetical protein
MLAPMGWGSTELEVLIRPSATFAALVKDPAEGKGRLSLRVGLLLLVLGCAVSLTTAGRLVPAHVGLGLVAWAFVPVIQIVGASIAIRAVQRDADLWRALSVYAAGNGPWLVAFTLLPTAMLLSPEAAGSFWIGRGALPIALALALLHGVFLTFTFHRAALGCTRGRALAATGIDLAAKTALSLLWFQGMDNLVPQFLGALAA